MTDVTSLLRLRWDGELLVDQEIRNGVATDLGMIVHEVPAAVLRPGSAQDVATLLVEAGRIGVPVTVRGLGSSTYGQSVPLPGGVVIDMSGFDRVHAVGSDRCVVDAGATWRSVVAATLKGGLTPPTLTDYIELTVGGTLSWGGMGPMSFRHGLQVDNVLELEVVTADGMIRHCSPTQEAALFQAVLGGMGLIAVITRVTLRLIAAPLRVRTLRFFYPDATALETDLDLLVQAGKVDTVEGLIVAPEGSWLYMLEASIFYDQDAPDEDAVASGLAGAPAPPLHTDLSYAEFVTRLGGLDTLPCGTAQKPHAHPWWATMTSQAVAAELIGELTTLIDPATAGPFDLIVTYPRFLSFTGRAGPSYGIVDDSGIKDLGVRFGDRWRTLRDVVAADASDVLGEAAAGLSADHAVSDIRYDMPLADAEKVICVGRNYPGRNADDPVTIEVPSLFVRFPDSLVGHQEHLVIPHESEQLDYEGEVVLVIGKAGRRIAERDALDHVGAITVCNEGLITDWMHKARFNVTQGKNFDATGAMGPWLVPYRDESQIADIALTTHVNGELRQSDMTGRMLYSFRYLIAYISTFATLKPGDIINTGSPLGKGANFTPPRWLRAGDVVEINAEGIGTLTNKVVSEAEIAPPGNIQ